MEEESGGGGCTYLGLLEIHTAGVGNYVDIFNQTESSSMQLMTSFYFVITDFPVQNFVDLILQAVCSVTLLEAALKGLSGQIILPRGSMV